MPLVYNPFQAEPAGRLIPVPHELKPYLVSWAATQCHAYDFGTVVRQTLATPDYRIYITIYNISTEVTLFPSWEKPTIALQYVRQGKILSCLNNTENIVLDTSRYHLFYIAPGQHVARLLPGLSEALRIEINPSYLEDLLYAHPSLQSMLDELDNQQKTAPLLSPATFNGKAKHVIHNMVQCRKKGPSLRLEMKAHIYELLSVYDEDISLTQDLESIQASRSEKKMMAVKNHIVQYPHIHECSIEQLARQFSISTSLLKISFKKQYGIPLGDFVQQECIQKAQQLLLEKIGTIQDIAMQLGYTDVSNFSRAFKNYMGCTPNELRMHPEKFRKINNGGQPPIS